MKHGTPEGQDSEPNPARSIHQPIKSRRTRSS
jgi:hypothetical protein